MSGPRPSASSMPAALRWVIAIVAGAIALNLLLVGLREALGGPGGPTSSSYATGATGVAAYAELLVRHSHPVVPLRGSLAENALDPSGTIVVLDPASLPPEDVDALRRYLEDGGRLVIGGGPPTWDRLLEHPPTWQPTGPTTASSLAPVPETEGVTRVGTEGEGSWSDTGGAIPAIGTSTDTIVAVAAVGSGRAVLLADASPLQNRLLGQKDNAAFGLALAGDGGRPVFFAEGVHGYGTETGLGAIPTRWKWTLAGLTLAALTWMVAKGRRLGPPEDEARSLPPPRRAYVDALANTLARTKDRNDAIAPVREAAMSRLARRAGLEPGADNASLRQAGAAFGLSEAEVAALLQPAGGRDETLAVGRALSKLSGGRK